MKTNHPKGISWNKNGLEPVEALQRIKLGQHSDPSLSNKKAIAIPTPPPLPSTLSTKDDRESTTGSLNMRDVFKEINKGENITSTLKKVDRRREWSNAQPRSGYNQSGVGVKASQFGLEGQANFGNTKMPMKKAQKHVLDGNRWIIV